MQVACCKMVARVCGNGCACRFFFISFLGRCTSCSICTVGTTFCLRCAWSHVNDLCLVLPCGSNTDLTKNGAVLQIAVKARSAATVLSTFRLIHAAKVRTEDIARIPHSVTRLFAHIHQLRKANEKVILRTRRDLTTFDQPTETER